MSDLSLMTVWDTDSPDAVYQMPDNVEAFLDYDDGNNIGQYFLRRFPGARPITITTVPAADNIAARMCDTEASGFTPEQAAYWSYRKITYLKERPTIYVEISEKPLVGVAPKVGSIRGVRAHKALVGSALSAYGLEFGRDVDCFYAWWNDDPNVRQGIYNGVGCGVGNVGHQYLNDGMLWDISVAYTQWVLGPWPPPVTPPAPPLAKGDTMFIENDNKYYQLIYGGPQSYWRQVPTKPTTQPVEPDPNGTWLKLWKVGQAGIDYDIVEV